MKILVKVDEIRLRAIELTVPDSGKLLWNEVEIEEGIVEQLVASGFHATGPLEFNLYEAGLTGSQTE